MKGLPKLDLSAIGPQPSVRKPKREGADRQSERMEKLCMAAYDNGERGTLQDAINELRASISGSAQGIANDERKAD